MLAQVGQKFRKLIQIFILYKNAVVVKPKFSFINKNRIAQNIARFSQLSNPFSSSRRSQSGFLSQAYRTYPRIFCELSQNNFIFFIKLVFYRIFLFLNQRLRSEIFFIEESVFSVQRNAVVYYRILKLFVNLRKSPINLLICFS